MDLSAPPRAKPKPSQTGASTPPRKTIVVWDIPSSINKRKTLLDHFTQFGDVERLTCSLKSKYAIIMFNKAEEAELARKTGNVIEGQKVQIFFTQKTPMGSGAKRRTPSVSDTSTSTARPQLDRSAFSSFRSKYALRNKADDKHSGPSFTKMRSSKPETDNEGSSSSFTPQPLLPITTGSTSFESARSVTVSTTVPKVTTTVSKSETVLALPSSSSSTRSKSPTKSIENDILSLYPDSSDAVELFGKKAFTSEDRYKILEARDKILRARIPKVKVRVELAAKLFGTCPDMCPEKETYMREYQRQLTPYETQSNQDQEVDHQKAIKAYSRSSADQEEPLPHELRPGKTLSMTMNYILHNIISRGENDEESLAEWYNFVWDRTRSIRKDITQQQLCDSEAVCLMEKCTRFHIHCSARLCELDRFSFDTKLNDENLMKCLQSLEHLYSDLRLKNVYCPNEPEFRSYQILMNLNEGDILWEIQQKPESILKSAPVQQALQIHHSVSSNNFVSFFRLVRQLPYLTSCIVHRYFFQVRSAALRTLVRSHSQKMESWVSAMMVQRMLGYGKDDQASFKSLFLAHGINADLDSDKIIISRRSFFSPEGPTVNREAHLIESKLTVPIAESINGGPLAPNPYPTHVPQCSFDDEGYLIPGPIISTTPRTPSAKTSPAFPVVKSNIVLPTSFSALAAASTIALEKPFSFTFSLPTQIQTSVRTPAPILAIQSTPTEVSTSATIVLPHTPDPRIIGRQRKEKMKDFSRNMAVSLFEKFREEAVTSILQDLYLKAYDENVRIKTVAKSLSQNISAVYFDKLRDDVINSLLHEIVKREIYSVKSQMRFSEQFLNSVLGATIIESISKICDEELSKHINESRLITKKAGELYGRIKLRGWVRIWRQFTEKKRAERKLSEENHRQLLRDFPAGNQYGKTVAEVLASWCGSTTSVDSLLVSNATSFVNESLHISSSEDEDSISSEDSMDNYNVLDNVQSDTVPCSYEEFLECYPGIENMIGKRDNEVENDEKVEEKTENPVIDESLVTRKRILSPTSQDFISSPPFKVSCPKLLAKSSKDASSNSKKVVVDVDVLCENINSLISKSKIERYVWDTDMSILDGSMELFEEELKSFHEDPETSYNELNTTVD